MPSIALYQPEIPPNTGNIIRLCANTGFALHLIHPLGFSIEDKQLKRAGLDYHECANIHHYENFPAFLEQLEPEQRLFACSTRGKNLYTDLSFEDKDVFLFGPETQGLPISLLNQLPSEHILRIPMLPTSRSLNLSNACAVVAYEALRQLGFANRDLK